VPLVACMLLLRCIYIIRKNVIILYIEVIQSALMCHCKIYIYIYIPLPIFNSDDVVMSRENQNFHLRLFVKGGALQPTIGVLAGVD
jgi:hypothetical protein